MRHKVSGEDKYIKRGSYVRGVVARARDVIGGREVRGATAGEGGPRESRHE